MQCPHANIIFCPLYIAAHEGAGCDDGRLEEGGCAVSRGMDYSTTIADLRPAIVVESRRRERENELADQRHRNMRNNGIR